MNIAAVLKELSKVSFIICVGYVAHPNCVFFRNSDSAFECVYIDLFFFFEMG